MMKKFNHKFVDIIPDNIDPDTIYVSTKYKTAIHICPCGCGNEVATPISPVDWKLTFDGESVSLYPSIGNWSLKCQSHYWIINNEVEWAPKWTLSQIGYGREKDEIIRREYYKRKEPVSFFESFFKKNK